MPQRAPPAIDMAIDHRPPHRERSRIRWCHHDRLLRWIEGRDNGLGINAGTASAVTFPYAAYGMWQPTNRRNRRVPPYEHIMRDAGLHPTAVHEAGHAVLARLFNLRLGPISLIDGGHADAELMANAEVRARIAIAGDVCMRAFGISTFHCQGGWSDEGVVRTVLGETHDEEEHLQRRSNELTAEVEEFFTRPNVRNAVLALAQALMREGLIEGDEAEATIDQQLTAC